MIKSGVDNIRAFLKNLNKEHGYSWQQLADEVEEITGFVTTRDKVRNFGIGGRMPKDGPQAIKAYQRYMNKKAPETGADLNNWRQLVFSKSTDVLREVVDGSHVRHACDVVDISGSYRGFKGSAFGLATCAFQLDIDNVDEALLFESVESNPRYYQEIEQLALSDDPAFWQDEELLDEWLNNDRQAREKGHLAGSFKLTGICGRNGENFQLMGSDSAGYRCFMQLRAVVRQNGFPLVLKGFEILTDDRSLLSISKVFCARIRREDIGVRTEQNEDLLDLAVEYLAAMDNQINWDDHMRTGDRQDRAINAVFCGHGGSSYGKEVNDELFEHFCHKPAHLLYQNRPDGKAPRTDDQITRLQILEGLEVMAGN